MRAAKDRSGTTRAVADRRATLRRDTGLRVGGAVRVGASPACRCLLHFDQVTGWLLLLPLLSSHRAGEGAHVSRLIVAVIVGIVIAVGAVALVENVLAGASNGSPTNASLYQYGSR